MLKSRWHTYTNSPPGQFVLLDLLAHRSAEMLIRLPSACRGKTAVQFPASSSHVRCVELALKWLLCTRVGRKGPLSTWALIRVNTFSWLPRPWWYGCAHALGTGRASFQFFFSISLKFRSRRKVFLDRLSRKRNEELLVYFNVFKTPVSKHMFREFEHQSKHKGEPNKAKGNQV